MQKISILDQNFDFWPKFQFLTKFSIFDKNIWYFVIILDKFQFYFRVRNFWPKFLSKISIFDQIFDFRPKFRYLRKISIFDQNFNFWQKYLIFDKFQFYFRVRKKSQMYFVKLFVEVKFGVHIAHSNKIRCLTNLSIVDQNVDVWTIFRFLDQNFDFWRKFWFLTKTSIFDQNSICDQIVHFWPPFQKKFQIYLILETFQFHFRVRKKKVKSILLNSLWRSNLVCPLRVIYRV